MSILDGSGASAAEPEPGLQLRLARFGSSIEFYAPGLQRWSTAEWTPANPRQFVPVSLTGTACALQCDHCSGRMLEGMATLGSRRSLFETADLLRAQGADGLLITGGSRHTGSVPLEPHLESIKRIREQLGMRVVVHSAVVTPRLADGLARAGVDTVMIDIIGARETIEDVYHLDRSPADFERSLELLAGHGLRTVPHIVLGLHWGHLIGEWDALEMIAAHPAAALVLVVLAPLSGTPMEHLPTRPGRRHRLLRARAPSPARHADQPRLRPPDGSAQAAARPRRDRPRSERHRLPRRRDRGVRACARIGARVPRALLLADLDGTVIRGKRSKSL